MPNWRLALQFLRLTCNQHETKPRPRSRDERDRGREIEHRNRRDERRTEDPFEGPYEQPGVPAGGPATETDDPSADAEGVGNSDGDDVVTGRTPDGARYESPPPPEDSSIPEDIPSPQGDDIAKQLREAAMAEQDPDLKAKLWKNNKRWRV